MITPIAASVLLAVVATAAGTPLPSEDKVPTAWWIVAGSVAMAVIGILGKVIDVRFFRDKDNTEFRRDLIRRVGALEQWNKDQQRTIDAQDKTIEDLRKEVDELRQRLNREQQSHHKERRLKHHYLGQVNVAALQLQEYRDKYGRMPEDTWNWDPAKEAARMDDPDGFPGLDFPT